VVISSAALSDYQVLLKLDENNFDFSQANDDGSDVRFTDGSSTYTLTYWIESWDSASQLAYIWVKVPTLENGYTNIYLYYDNPVANTASDGTATFDFFDDDWSEFLGETCANIEWYCPDNKPGVISGIVVLSDTTGISTLDPYLYKAVGYRANFGLGNGLEWGGFIDGGGGPRTMIRDLPDDVHNLFLQDRNLNLYEKIRLVPVGVSDWHDAFHIYEIRWREGQSIADIDHGTSGVESMISDRVPNGQLPITFYSSLGSNSTLFVDWVYVRQYHNPEPITTIGTGQGLVDLGVSLVDTPDPSYTGEVLTYLLTISNTSGIDAPGAILTDTLPGEVQLASTVPSQGSCNNEIVCSLGTISANITVNITVVVTTTSDGVFTNTAVVGSLGYDSDLSNNTYEEMTTVLPSADLAITNQGYPEVVKPGDYLTYTLSITNFGPSEVQFLRVDNYMPTGVKYKNSFPIDCTEDPGKVSCTLSQLASSTDTQILIFAQVLSTRTITSTATVSSTTYDPDPTNNTHQEVTQVDAEIPVVNWVSPVQEEDTFFTKGGQITLEASAYDNDQVNRVEFKYWDHINLHYVVIGSAISSPYQVEFDSDVLETREIYQMFVTAFDRAGNASDRQRIFIERLPKYIFIPIISRK
jgi:uncharacterized repeat protein (TIGR01451 family)